MPLPLMASPFLLSGMQMWWPEGWQLYCSLERKVKTVVKNHLDIFELPKQCQEQSSFWWMRKEQPSNLSKLLFDLVLRYCHWIQLLQMCSSSANTGPWSVSSESAESLRLASCLRTKTHPCKFLQQCLKACHTIQSGTLQKKRSQS